MVLVYVQNAFCKCKYLVNGKIDVEIQPAGIIEKK
jgi:hypothetical protein